MENKTSVHLKVIVLGLSTVGKSSILRRYNYDTFQEKWVRTSNIEFLSYKNTPNDKKYKFKIDFVDIPGQGKYKMSANYFKGSNGIIMVYDLTNLQSFEALNNWLDIIKGNCPVLLLGNKCDLETERQVSSIQIEEFLRNNQLDQKISFEVSAKTDDNVKSSIDLLYNKMCDMLIEKENQEELRGIKLDLDKKEKCCLC